jgi:hypothetical protein
LEWSASYATALTDLLCEKGSNGGDLDSRQLYSAMDNFVIDLRHDPGRARAMLENRM